jgi:hypothetical protein
MQRNWQRESEEMREGWHLWAACTCLPLRLHMYKSVTAVVLDEQRRVEERRTFKLASN